MTARTQTQRKNIFAVLSSETREKITQILSEKPLTFTELSRSLGIPSSKLNFHLKKMGILVEKTGHKYHLSEVGKNAHTLLRSINQVPIAEEHIGIAAIGMLLDPNDVDSNIKQALRSIDFAIQQKTDLICLPILNLLTPIPAGRVIHFFQNKAREHKVHIAFGLFELNDEQKHNSAILVKPEGSFDIYRSIHQDVDALEKIETGNDIVVVDSGIGKIGLAVKDDYIYPEFFRMLKLKGADYVMCCAIGIQAEYQRIVQSIILTRAIENQLAVAFTSSSCFPEDPMGLVCSPNQQVSFTICPGGTCIQEITMEDIKKNRQYFELRFPRRPQMYGELAKCPESIKDDNQKVRPAHIMYPATKTIRRIEVHSEDHVQFEEVTFFEKPLHVNLPRTYCIKGILPFREARDMRWFDSLGTVGAIVIQNKPHIRFFVQERCSSTPGKSYMMGFRCNTPDPIKVKNDEAILDLSFEDFNQGIKMTNATIGEYIVEVSIDPKFKVISSSTANVPTKTVGKSTVMTWRWTKPQRLPKIQIRLSKTQIQPTET